MKYYTINALAELYYGNVCFKLILFLFHAETEGNFVLSQYDTTGI